jgi:hypothetical protein
MFKHLWLSSLVLVACGGSSGGNGDDMMEMTPDAIEEVTGCTSAAECEANAPICSATSNTCVECETSEQCPSDRPVCSNGSCNAACAGTEITADFVQLPVDIIWVVDQSGSMDQETQYVQSKINDFVTLIGATNIDYRVTMMAAPSGTNAICVPGPLGGASCGNNTRFRLANQRIGSTDGPSQVTSKYALYSDFLRADATKHFVFVTDDNSAMSAVNFTNAVNALQPAGMFTNFKVHAIYAYGQNTTTGCTGPFGTGAKLGAVYTTLVANTGGARGVICQDDWNTVFADITTAIVSGSQVACELAIPAPPQGETLDLTKVNVKYQSGANSTTLMQVPTANDCTTGGWYYDDNTAPTKISLCPATCSAVQQDANANLKIELGCATVIL